MKAFIFGYSTNYDLGAAIIYAESKERAIKLAQESNSIWDCRNVHEINLNNTERVIIILDDKFWEEYVI